MSVKIKVFKFFITKMLYSSNKLFMRKKVLNCWRFRSNGLYLFEYLLNKNCLIYEKIGRLKKNQSKMLVF